MDFEELLDKAKQGDERAITTLGEAFWGLWDMAIDYERCKEVLRKLAEQGNAEAQYQLGECILFEREENGKCGPGEAIEWWERAEQLGHADAPWRLGRLYEMQYDCADAEDLDFVQAAKWYRVGAKRGDKQASEALGRLDALREQAEQWSDEEAPKLMREELQNWEGDSPVVHSADVEFVWFALGRLFQYGNDTVPPNEQRAMVCLLKSGEYGTEHGWDLIDDVLRAAAERGDLEPLKAMCALGFTDEALLSAALRGSPKEVKFLLEAGADVNAKDNEGRTALDLADGRTRSAKLLRAAGAKKGK